MDGESSSRRRRAAGGMWAFGALAAGLVLALLAGCGAKTPLGTERDAGMDAAPPRDTGPRDSGIDVRDAGRPDTGPPPVDAGPSLACDAERTFVVPFGEPPDPPEATVAFESVGLPSEVQIADLYFLFDITTSMRTEIATLRDAVESITASLQCEDFGTPCVIDDDCDAGRVCGPEATCIEDPSESSCISSVWTGVGTYEGFTDSYRNRLSLQPDPVATSETLADLRGGGRNESLFESVACVADPSVCDGAGCAMGGIGCPAFREEATRIVVTFTDEPDQCTDCSADSASAAGGRLLDRDILFVGIDASDRRLASPHLRAIARASDSFDATGAPLVFEGTDREVADALVEAIDRVAGRVPRRATATFEELPGDDGDARPFVESLAIDTSGAGCTDAMPREDTDGDGLDDAFTELLPGVPVCWRLLPSPSGPVPPTGRVQRFRAEIVARADGEPVADRSVCFVVPPG